MGGRGACPRDHSCLAGAPNGVPGSAEMMYDSYKEDAVYTIIWEANGIHHECKTKDRLTARQVQEAIIDYWHGDGIVVKMWDGQAVVKEEVS